LREVRLPCPLETEDQLEEFLWLAWKVRIPKQRVCDDHKSPWEAFCDAYFRRYPVTVWKASRGFGGKSYLLALLGLTEAVTLKCDVGVLGGSGEQSQRVHGYTQDFWKAPNAPRFLLSSDPSKRDTFLKWGNSISTMMASQKSVRGPHPPRLRMDEVDEMDIKILYAALGQPMGKKGVLPQTVLSSTHQNADGTMTQILRDAAEKGWPVYEWCYRETLEPHGWLPEREIEEKRATVPKSMWDTEYELQDPNPEARAIQTECVDAMFDKRLGEYSGALGQIVKVEPRVATAKYFHGTDWAKAVDFTVILTFRQDARPWKLVAFERSGRMPWPVMVKKFNDRVKEYPGKAAHDATGVGGVVSDLLTVRAQDVLMVGRTRADMLSEYIAAIEQGNLRAPMIDFMYGEHKYASREDVYSGGSTHHLPDSISAGALALWAKNHAGGVLFG